MCRSLLAPIELIDDFIPSLQTETIAHMGAQLFGHVVDVEVLPQKSNRALAILDVFGSKKQELERKEVFDGEKPDLLAPEFDPAAPSSCIPMKWNAVREHVDPDVVSTAASVTTVSQLLEGVIDVQFHTGGGQRFQGRSSIFGSDEDVDVDILSRSRNGVYTVGDCPSDSVRNSSIFEGTRKVDDEFVDIPSIASHCFR